MIEKAVLITGTPCVGKTSVARLFATKIDAFYLNLTDFVVTNNLYLGRDEKRDSLIVDEEIIKRKISEIIKKCKNKFVVIDGHYAVNVVPIEFVKIVFVLRRDPIELKEFMIKRGFHGQKLDENLASEILDVCLVEALEIHPKNKICEYDVTSKSIEKIVSDIMEIINRKVKCKIGVVDWLGKLEKEKKLNFFNF